MALFVLKSLSTQKTCLSTRRSMSSATPHHGYHLVDPSPWPALTRFCLLWLMVSLVLCFHQYTGAASLALVAFSSLTYTASVWWRDVNREGILGYHTGKVKNGLHLGMWLFIWSEAMFFVGLLWAFMHAALMPTVQIGMCWPPLGVVPVHWTGLPKTNTLLLLASFFTRNAAKHAIDTNNKSLAKFQLLNTIALGAQFLYCQYLEYTGAAFTFSDSVFGSAFYLTTGFHGFHVLVGRLYLAVCYFTISTAGPGKSTAMDLAIQYWHFVDVVWIALMLIVYIWGSSLPVVEMSSCTDSSCAVMTLLHERKTYAWSHGQNASSLIFITFLKF